MCSEPRKEYITIDPQAWLDETRHLSLEDRAALIQKIIEDGRDIVVTPNSEGTNNG